MPFPYQSLPYGLRGRLRELATPIEALHIQIAAGHHCSGLQPFQPLIYKVGFRFFRFHLLPHTILLRELDRYQNRNDYLKVGVGYDNTISNTVPVSSNFVTFYDMPANLFKNGKYDHFYVNWTENIVIQQNDTLTLSFLKAVKLHVDQTSNLMLYTPFCDISYKDIFIMYPNLSKATFHYVSKNWIDDLLTLNVKNLELTLTLVNFLDFKNLEFKKLVQLVEVCWFVQLITV
uniref:Methyltransf_11 domain-containing protein n=1 Tax=Panagrellus redivivus TaxID=6233 RepID=A0A7E4VKP3_PANRE